MPQARVYEPENTPHGQDLTRVGFRWCKKDGRWEKNCKDPKAVLESIQEEWPEVRVESAESDNAGNS